MPISPLPMTLLSVSCIGQKSLTLLKYGGKLRTKNHASVWPRLLLSQISSTSGPKRIIERAFSAVISIQADELILFFSY